MSWPFKKDESVTEENKTQSKNEADTLVERLNQSFADQLKPIADKMATFEERFGKIETNTTRQAPTVENKTEIPSVFDNESGAFEAHLAPLKAELIVRTAQLNANIIESAKIEELTQSGWGELVAEVKKIYADCPIEFKGKSDYSIFAQNVIDMAIGRAAKKGGVRMNQQTKTFFVEDASLVNSAEKTGKLGQIESEASDGRVDITKGQSAGDWLNKKLGIDPAKFAESIN